MRSVRATPRPVAACPVAVALVAASLAVLPASVSASVSASATPAFRFIALAAVPSAAPRGTLDAVACATPLRCVTVGATTSGRAGVASGTESDGRWSWSSWSDVTSRTSAVLLGVSCPTTTSCVAVGSVGPDGATQALVGTATLGDGRWRWRVSVLPASGGASVVLDAVSCATDTTCVAVGSSTSTTTEAVATVATRVGASWGWAPLAVVGSDATGAGTLRSVDCTIRETCVAVGADGAGAPTWSVAGWEGASLVFGSEEPLPAAPSLATLSAVACSNGPSRCVAVGTDATGAVVAHGRLSASGWGWSAPTPAVAAGSVRLAAVSCAGACVSVGATAAGAPTAVVAPGPDTAAAWGPPLPVPEGEVGPASLRAVACPAPADCVAVGSTPSGQEVVTTTRSAPWAVRAVRARPGDGRATVRFVAPRFDGGARIGSYRVVADPGGASCTVATVPPLRCTVLGLVNGHEYRFTVTARNGLGVGPASVASPPVRPREFQPPVASPFTARVRALVAAAGGTVSASVDDVLTGQRWTIDPSSEQHTASIVKADILATLLYDEQQAHQPMPPATRALATAMIDDSDNDAAQALYVQIGQAPGLAAFDARAGLTATTPNDAWGFTDTTAIDQTKVVALFALPNTILDPASRALGLGLLRHVTPAQAWGVSAGPPPSVSVALKNGWYPTAPGNWQVNSIGWVDGRGRDYVLAVLTDDHDTMGQGVDAIQSLSVAVWRNLGHRQAVRS